MRRRSQPAPGPSQASRSFRWRRERPPVETESQNRSSRACAGPAALGQARGETDGVIAPALAPLIPTMSSRASSANASSTPQV